ncbi:3-isopropylmalate dehydratase [Candidatus Thorarchaeota archaeon]|nr:MAG: 3-isopropylmalate dehydratase [Candidatus Thorarchaeota archaeon]
MGEIEGRAWLVGDNIDTDQIVPGRYLTLLEYREMAQHALEVVRPDFAENVEQGDILVAGRNLGAGSSREEAPEVLHTLGIRCIIAESVARLFYRNSFNIGLPVIMLDSATTMIADGDLLSVDLVQGSILNRTKKRELHAESIPPYMLELIEAGGAVQKYRKEMTRKR